MSSAAFRNQTVKVCGRACWKQKLGDPREGRGRPSGAPRRRRGGRYHATPRQSPIMNNNREARPGRSGSTALGSGAAREGTAGLSGDQRAGGRGQRCRLTGGPTGCREGWPGRRHHPPGRAPPGRPLERARPPGLPACRGPSSGAGGMTRRLACCRWGWKSRGWAQLPPQSRSAPVPAAEPGVFTLVTPAHHGGSRGHLTPGCPH